MKSEKEFWDEWYIKGAHWEKGHSKVINYMISDLKKTHKILDIGCGTGRDCLLLTKKGFNVIGLDLSEAGIKRAREIAKKEGLKIRFDIGCAEKLPYTDKSFDIVFSAYTLQRTDLQEAVKEIWRVLKDNGKVYAGIILVKEYLKDKKRVLDFEETEFINAFSKYFTIIKKEIKETVDKETKDEPEHFHRNLFLILKRKN